MRYMFINVSNSNLQVDLFSPNTTHKNQSLHRVAPVVSLSLKKGESINILPYFKNVLEDAHNSVLHSRNVLHLLKPNQLNTYVCDDAGKEINIDKLLGHVTFNKQIVAPKKEEPKVEEPKVEEPKVEEPKVEEPKVEEPKVEAPKVEDPKVESVGTHVAVKEMEEEDSKNKKMPKKKGKK